MTRNREQLLYEKLELDLTCRRQLPHGRKIESGSRMLIPSSKSLQSTGARVLSRNLSNKVGYMPDGAPRNQPARR